jgi:hypothetical protein
VPFADAKRPEHDLLALLDALHVAREQRFRHEVVDGLDGGPFVLHPAGEIDLRTVASGDAPAVRGSGRLQLLDLLPVNDGELAAADVNQSIRIQDQSGQGTRLSRLGFLGDISAGAGEAPPPSGGD